MESPFLVTRPQALKMGYFYWLVLKIGQFRYIKIQPKTKDLSTRLWGINTEFVGFYSPEPRAEVYCFRLNFNISKLVYSNHLHTEVSLGNSKDKILS